MPSCVSLQCQAAVLHRSRISTEKMMVVRLWPGPGSGCYIVLVSCPRQPGGRTTTTRNAQNWRKVGGRRHATSVSWTTNMSLLLREMLRQLTGWIHSLISSYQAGSSNHNLMMILSHVSDFCDLNAIISWHSEGGDSVHCLCGRGWSVTPWHWPVRSEERVSTLRWLTMRIISHSKINNSIPISDPNKWMVGLYVYGGFH